MSPRDPPPADASSDEDARLVERYLARGEERDFRALVERYRERVHRLVSSCLGPGFAHEAEDVTQEVFVRVHQKLPRFRRESRFSTWLYRIAHNAALDERRRARYRYPHTTDEVLSARPAEEAEGPLAGTLDRERQRAVRRAVESLPDPYRTALHLFYWLETPVSEIAELLGTRPGTVKSYLFRARERLSRLLDQGSCHDES